MCSPQQACSKLVNKLKQCCYFIKLLQGCHAQLVDKLVNCKTITSFGTTCNKTVELNNLVASCQQVVDNLSTSWEKAVRFTSCWQVVFLGVVCFCVCNGNMALLLLLLFFFFTDCHST
jgi:hypothetical protein